MLVGNYMGTLRGIGYLPQLLALLIANNRLETLYCKPTKEGYPRGLLGLTALEMLDVSQNNLTDLYGMHLAPLENLKYLKAGSNELSHLEFISKNWALQELDVNKNKIRQIEKRVFESESNELQILRIEENNLKSFKNFEYFGKLKGLFAELNLIKEINDLD